jgi:RNA 3'-terminal phosphate cyclase (ATP)
MLTIDGSHGEGGGQILRTALALSTITGRPMRIEHIRAGRKNPGLRPQHLTAVRAAAAICGAQLEEDELGSQTLTFVPGDPPRPGEYVFDVAEASQGGSAGSVGLVLQTVLLPLALAQGQSHLTIRGGTHVPWAPPASYLVHVFLPTVARMGVHAQIELVRWGFYPAGGGEIQVQIEGKTTPNSVQLTEQGKLRRVWGTAAVMNLPAHIPQRMANRAHNVLAEAGIQAQVEPRRLRGAGPGAGIFLFAEYEAADQKSTYAGFTAYGRQGLPAEHVAEAVCESLLTHHRSGSPVDLHLADQLALPMALAQGESKVTTAQVSHHLLTNAWVIGQFLPQALDITGQQGASGMIIAKGTRHD